jgi:hypothetical protein
MKKLLAFLIIPLLMAMSPFQPLTTVKTDAVASQVLTHLNLKTIKISWNAETTARYVFVFDGVAVPTGGTVTNCSTSHVTGCALWCQYMINSGTAPSNDWADWGVAPLAAKFGLVIAVSTGAGCNTFTTDAGVGNSITSQAY